MLKQQKELKTLLRPFPAQYPISLSFSVAYRLEDHPLSTNGPKSQQSILSKFTNTHIIDDIRIHATKQVELPFTLVSSCQFVHVSLRTFLLFHMEMMFIVDRERSGCVSTSLYLSLLGVWGKRRQEVLSRRTSIELFFESHEVIDLS